MTKDQVDELHRLQYDSYLNDKKQFGQFDEFIPRTDSPKYNPDLTAEEREADRLKFKAIFDEAEEERKRLGKLITDVLEHCDHKNPDGSTAFYACFDDNDSCTYCGMTEQDYRKSLPPKLTSWTKGQLIRSHEELWEVTEVFEEGDTLEITPLELSGHMDSYIQKGNKYRLIKHTSSGWSKGTGLWEIPSEIMTRSSSQVLLYLWEEGPSIEIDC